MTEAGASPTPHLLLKLSLMSSWSKYIPKALVLDVRGEAEVRGVTDNSKEVAPGSVFFAIKGGKFDGHDLAPALLKQGAAYAVVERPEVFASLERAILVRSTRQAWAHAAAASFGDPSLTFPLVGVTGTNGKTTTAYLLFQVWEKMGFSSGLIGTVECRIGDKRLPSELTTPGALELQSLFFQMKEAQVKFAAMEVSSIALDQYRTAATAFRVAIFTNLTQDHLDYHGDFDAYWKAKQKFFIDYNLNYSVVNADDPRASELLALPPRGTVLRFSMKDPSAEFFASQVEFDRKSSRALLKTPEGEFKLSIPLIGHHNIYNALGVIAANYALGLPLDKVVRALEDAPGAPGRLERVKTPDQAPNVFVDYAHSPDALDNVLRALRKLRGEGAGKIITVFGCGGDRDRTKRPKMARVVSELSDVMVVTSDNPRTENPDAIVEEIITGIPAGRPDVVREVNRRVAIHKALELSTADDLVLIAGKGHENYQIIGTQKFPFDDGEVVREYYST